MFKINMELTIQATDNSVKFSFNNGDFSVYPHGSIIAIADTSDRISFKLLASRKTIFSYPFGSISPSGATASETVTILNSIL